MRVVYVTTGDGSKSQNENIWRINLNNYKTLLMRDINSVMKFINCSFSVKNYKIKKLKFWHFEILVRHWQLHIHILEKTHQST